MRRAIVAGVLLVLVAAAPAEAGYPGQRPADEVRLDAMLGVAHRFWQDRGVASGCPDVKIDVADTLYDPRDGADHTARAIADECRIIVAAWYVRRRLETGANRRLYARFRREALARLCAVIAHEDGHLRGLAMPSWDGTRWVDTHPGNGLMAPKLTPDAVPWDCRLLARHLVPRERVSRAGPGRRARIR